MRVTPCIDAASIWRSLAPEQQLAIGVALVDLELAEQRHYRLNAAIDLQTFNLAEDNLIRAAEPIGEVIGGMATEELPVPSFGLAPVRYCHGCGCTDLNGCHGGCHWITETLCSACVAPPTEEPF